MLKKYSVKIFAKIKWFLQKVSSLFIDSYIIPSECPKISASEKAIISWRYRLAGIGIPLTQNEKRLLDYKNKHLGQRAFIIGNGPSLNNCDLHPLKKEITFGSNSIFLNYDHMGFHPTYYVVEDIFVAEDRASLINSYQGPIKFFGNYLHYCIDNKEDVIWLNVRMRYEEYKDFPHFSTNALRMVWTGGTVSYINLQLAYYMGFSEVYLIGFDHSYQIPADAMVRGTVIVSNNTDPNHFHPEYFGKGFRWHDPRIDRMELAYHRSKTVFEASGKRILNATVGGKLEVFDRVQYSSLF